MSWLSVRLGRAGLDDLLRSNSVGSAEQTSVFRADGLVESIGINVHLNFRRHYWGLSPGWKDHLRDLRLRTIRTGMGMLAAAKADYQDLGMKGLIGVAKATTEADAYPVFDPENTRLALNFLRDEIGVENVLAVEGPNEPNEQDRATPGWETRTREIMGVIKMHVANDPELAPVSIVGPSIWGRIPGDYRLLGDMSALIDVANLHNYTGGQMPSMAGAGRGSVTTLDRVLADARAVAPGKPLWVTEYNHPTGFPTSMWIVPEGVAASYLLRGLLLNLQKGVERTFIYALGDMVNNDAKFGLLAVEGTGAAATYAPRQSYHALRRLISLFIDPGPRFTPTPLAYKLEGDLAGVERMLFQKRDGSWILAVWQEVSLWNRALAAPITPARRQITLTLPSASSVKAYEPTESEAGDTLATASRRVSLSVPGHVMVLVIAPHADPVAP